MKKPLQFLSSCDESAVKENLSWSDKGKTEKKRKKGRPIESELQSMIEASIDTGPKPEPISF